MPDATGSLQIEAQKRPRHADSAAIRPAHRCNSAGTIVIDQGCVICSCSSPEAVPTDPMDGVTIFEMDFMADEAPAANRPGVRQASRGGSEVAVTRPGSSGPDQTRS